MVISNSAILRHTCTPNVSPHVQVRTVVDIHVYENILLRFAINEIRYLITQSTWSQIILAATLLYQIINNLAKFSEIWSYLP